MSAWLAPLCVAAWLLVPASAGAISSAACDNRANDTPKKLVACINTDDLWQHMQAFQAIADANPGADGHPSRNSGEPGYKASVDYVARAMRQAGYDVTIQPYTFDYFVLRRDADVQRGLTDRARLYARHRVESRNEHGDTTAAQVSRPGAS